MPKRPTVTTVTSGFNSQTTINTNFTNTRNAFDNTLSRDGSTPNNMQADLDMDGNDVLNAHIVTADDVRVGGVSIGSVINLETVSARQQVFSPIAYGAEADGTTDDSAAWQTALDTAALAGAGAIVDGGGLEYAIGTTLDISGMPQVIIRNARFKPVGTWAASDPMISGDNDAPWGTPSPWLEKLYIDCEHECSGIYLRRNNFMRISDCVVSHFATFGIKSETKNTGLWLTRVDCHKYLFDDVGRADGANRTGIGFHLLTADFTMDACYGYYCEWPLYLDGFFNAQVNNSHFWAGSVDTNPDTAEGVVYLGPNVSGVVFSGNYFDNGAVVMDGAFAHIFTGNLFNKNAEGDNVDSIRLIATQTNSTADGLIVLGSQFTGSTTILNFATNGGTWGTPDLVWIGNRKADGGLAWKWFYAGERFFHDENLDLSVSNSAISILNFLTTTAVIKTTRALRLSADPDNLSGAGSTEVILATDGTDRWQVAGSGAAGALSPSTDRASSIGTTTLRPELVYGARVALIDGVTAPGAIAGHAQIYVDSADGDLKVRFGDGTIKTIVTDT